MALETFNALLNSANEVLVYPRMENNRLTGLVGLKKKSVKIPEPKGAISLYTEANYIIPKFGKKEEERLEKALEEIEKRNNIEVKYSRCNVTDKKLLKQGLKKSIVIAFAGSRESANYENMKLVNKALKFKDYDTEKYLDVADFDLAEILFPRK